MAPVITDHRQPRFNPSSIYNPPPMEDFALPDVSDSDDAEVTSSRPSQVCFTAAPPDLYPSNPISP